MFVNNQTKWNDELVVDDNEGKYVPVDVGGGGGGGEQALPPPPPPPPPP